VIKTLKGRIIIPLLGILVVFAVILSLVVTGYVSRMLMKRKFMEGMAVARTLGYSSELAIFSGDATLIEGAVNGLLSEENILGIALYDINGNPILVRGKIEMDTTALDENITKKALEKNGIYWRERNHTVCIAPVYSTSALGGEKTPIGFVMIISSLEDVFLARRYATLLSFISSLIFVLAGIGVTYLSVYWATHKIKDLSGRMREIAEGQGDLTRRVEVEVKDEVGELAEAFNLFMDGIERIVRETKDVANRLASHSEELSASSQEMTASSEEISSTIQEISQASSKQAEEVQKAVEMAKKALDVVKLTVSKAQETEEASSVADALSREGKLSADEAAKRMVAITAAMEELLKVAREVGEKSERISVITDTIEGITKRTNILALNATIEAARAGEYGRGFAVVADEVRKLAARSAESTREISTIVESIKNAIEEMVKKTELSTREIEEGRKVIVEAAENLKRISDEVSKAIEKVREIVKISRQGEEEVNEIVKSVENIATIAEENAASAEEVSAAVEEQAASIQELTSVSQETANLSEKLSQLIGRFRVKEG